ncbi:hypothetical protein [Pseudarthrobacter sp. BIM B-2242]|uniref:hypothetical protein n=1 Tax=Pseudarthrobacter sp. BIM B-2242 TaxID=2772401 RepID=UPI00168B0FD6|nr:hypothetical protein [Pseudarthrobacter sp. BIM B-2242]QOD05910.1 hypothetical protein IDT60_20280 [Pseudarthrobacter sp. BIM B-2242]
MSTETPAPSTFMGRLRAFNWKTPGLWVAVSAVAYLHAQFLFIAPYTSETISWLLPLLLALPGLLTMILLKNGFRRWYRWAAICLLFTTTFTDSAVAVLAVGEAWALHRQWVVEREGPLFRFGKLQAAPEEAPKPSTGTSGRQRKPKTA